MSTNFQGKQTYLFSPLLESEAGNLRTTDALHERKLFVAHILFGHEKATRQGGRIKDPVVLVDALLRRGVVGPAPNIATDYQLLEAKGIVRVEMSSGGPLMRMVKEDIIADSLGLLERTLGPKERDAQSTTPLASLRPPGVFITPERDRSQITEDEASMEIMHAAVDRLREEAQRATRHEDPF